MRRDDKKQEAKGLFRKKTSAKNTPEEKKARKKEKDELFSVTDLIMLDELFEDE